MRPAVLVTGGGGYIGSATCKALAKAGYLPVALDNLCRGDRSAVKWGPFENCDLQDRADVCATFDRHKPIAVLHFAAYAYVNESMSNPELYYQNNLVNSLTLLDCMQSCGVNTIVFSSSCAAYGLPQETPIRESHPMDPINPYGESKRAVESALRWYGASHGLRWTALRYFNAAGADPEGEVGEAHSCQSRLVPVAIEAALGQRTHVQILGTDYPTPDGTAIRDYVHVMDLANAHVRALEYLLEGGRSRPFNLGGGIGYSVREVVAAVEQVLGVEGIGREAPRRPGDPPCLVADSSSAKEVLGWEPEISSLEEIVRTASSWMSSRKVEPMLSSNHRERIAENAL